jgi:hypothetical protein
MQAACVCAEKHQLSVTPVTLGRSGAVPSAPTAGSAAERRGRQAGAARAGGMAHAAIRKREASPHVSR